MRESLTVVAILLIAVLTAALVAPYFVDWTAHRALIEAKLSATAGTRVTVAGPISVKLLPQPVFRLGSVTVGEAAQAHFSAEAVDVSLSMPALLRGEVQVSDATLRRPRLDLTADGGAVLSKGIGAPERFGFQHVAVQDGAVSFAAPDGRRTTLSGLDFDAEAVSLLGPFRITGRYGQADDPRPFRLSTGAFENGRLRVKLSLDGGADRPAVDLDGVVSPAPADGQPALDMAATLAGSLPTGDESVTVPWRLAGHARGTAASLDLSDLDLTAGAGLTALAATGDGRIEFGDAPKVALSLHGPTANLDTLAVASDDSGAIPRVGFDLLKQLAGSATTDSESASRLPAALSLDLKLDTVTAGQQTIVDLDAHVALERGRPVGLRLSAGGPDAARLMLDGTLETGRAPVFRGRLEASTRDLPHFAAWLAPAWPEAPASIRRTIPAKLARFAGTVDLSRIGISARDATLTLDRTSADGTLSYTTEVGDEPARLFADLRCDALDLDALPDLSSSAVDWTGLDLDVAFSARAVSVLPGEAGGAGPLDAGHVSLRLKKTGATLTLDEASADLGGARLSGTGRSDGSTGSFDAHVDAPQLDTLAAALARLAPGRTTAMLQGRAASLSPARLDLHLDAAQTGDGSFLPSRLSLSGTAGVSRVRAALTPDRAGDLDPATATVSAEMTADADDGFALLRQLGWPTAAKPSPPSGPGRFAASAHGSAAAGFDGSAELSLPGVTLGFKGRANPDFGSGTASLAGTDLAPLLVASGLSRGAVASAVPAKASAALTWHDGNVALHGLAARVAGTEVAGDLLVDLTADPDARDSAAQAGTKPVVSGSLHLGALDLATLFGLGFGPSTPPTPDEGRWSAKPFGPTVLQIPRAAIAIKADALGLGRGLDAGAASLTVRSERGALSLGDFTAAVAGGQVNSTLTLRRDNGTASLNGALSWTGLALDRPSLKATVSGAVEFAGSGTTPASLVASLGGTGAVRITNGRIEGLDPAALARTAAALEKTDTADLDADSAAKVLATELSRAPLRLGETGGQATLTAGTLALGPFRVEAGQRSAEVDAKLDVRTFDAAIGVALKDPAPLPGWTVAPAQIRVSLDGPLDAPLRRDIDAAGFVNALQARAIARDQERIDVFQQDVRERAFFNRRRKAVEADQQAARDRAKAAADAARAAAADAARAAADAARSRPKPDSAPAVTVTPAPPGDPAAAVEAPRSGPPLPSPRRPASRTRRPQEVKPPAGFDLPAPPPVTADPLSSGRF